MGVAYEKKKILIKILKSQLFFISLQKKKITYKNFHIDTNQDVTFKEGGNIFVFIATFNISHVFFAMPPSLFILNFLFLI